MNTEEIIEKFKQTHGDRYDYSKSVYINAKTPITVICKKHGEFSPRPGRHADGSHCPKCARENLWDTTDVFIEKATKKHGTKYDYSKSNYTNSVTKVSIVCSIHGEFSQTPAAHIGGQGCPKCGRESIIGRQPKSTEQFIEESKSVHGDKYDYSRVVYKATTTPVEIICNTHGSFYQKPQVHIRGSGCSECHMDTVRVSTEDFVDRASTIHNNKYDYTNTVLLKSVSESVSICCPIHGDFSQVAATHLSGAGCPKCIHIISKAELEVLDFVRSLGFDAHSTRKIISPKELDIYIPEKNLSIEFNGVYWHSSGSVEDDLFMSKKHLEKTELCEQNGIQLLHIFENEWEIERTRNIWKGVIRAKLGSELNRIFARKTEIREVDKAIANEFCNINHLQGACSHSRASGLFHNDELVMVATFSKPRYNNTHSTELIRLCSKLGVSVVGGASKLLKPESDLVSYANRRWSVGGVYDKIGFERIGTTKPSYYYYHDCTPTELFHRSSFMKHKLSDKLELFDESMSERENMYKNNYRRIWDCGTIVYSKK